jgi:ABC-type nickel/cobalt efflux system permease component RcnA
VFGLDDRIVHLSGSGGSVAIVLAVALLLGLRHASDPDHLAAVSTLIASRPDEGRRRAAGLGLAWGLGHASALLVFGLPIVLARSYLPETVQRAAELLVGLVIVALALRLLVRWRSGAFHVHAHRHGPVEHRHLHPHADDAGHEHVHAPERRLGRSPAQAFGIGLVHGTGGSAGVGVLLIAGIPDRGEAAVALLVFAVATAVSMAMLSFLFGYALTRGPVLRRVMAVTPVLGALSLAFGAWYALASVGA